MDAKSRVIEDGAIAIRDGSIAAIGERDDIESGRSSLKRAT